MKKLLIIIFAMIIILEIIPVLSFAEEADCVLFGGVEIPKNITKICIGTDKLTEDGSDTYSLKFMSNVNVKELYQKLPELEKITISKCKVRYAGYFSKFKNLETLELYNCTGISGLDFAPNCRKLTEFAFTQEGLNDISVIGRMTKLKKLTIADATTYGYLSGEYVKLREKVQNGGYLSDLSPLGNLTELTELTVEGAAIEDITPLLSMSKLTALTLSNAVKTDLIPLENLDNLKSFTFRNYDPRFINQSSRYDYVELPALKHLIYLSLNDCKIYDDVLDGFPELKTLNLTDCNIKSRNGKYEYSGSPKLPKLETMTISGVSIADNLISQFTSLKTLTISGSRIIDTVKTKTSSSSINYSLSYLKDLKNLKSLTVYHCYINDIKGLKNLSNLEYLDLAGNTLTDLTPLKNLKKLKYLDLSDALDGDSSERYYGDDVLSPLNNLKKLEYLDISGIYDLPEDYCLWKPDVKNSIFDILVSLPRLKTLTISPIYEYGNLMEEEEKERIKLFEEKMPYCELNIEYPDIAF